MIAKNDNSRNWACDLVFVIFAALYALCALDGIIDISGQGARMDSDLATYAQAMANEAHPGFFASDPVLGASSPAVDIRNLERSVAAILEKGDNPAAALLRAGALALFIFYCGWYIMGRWLFERPALAALLAVICGITVWIEYGTFWGVNHSDPIPRVYFAAIFPLLLLCALFALNHAKYRPLVMFLTGLCIWVHGVSALNCGAMFMVAFALAKPEKIHFSSHLWGLFACLCAFLLPVVHFLWPSLGQGKDFSAEELAVFQELFNLRWEADYSNPLQRMIRLMTTANAFSLLALFGFFAWIVTVLWGDAREKTLARACPAFIIGIGLVFFFSFAESRCAPELGRLPMGHELVRGIRFLVPLSILMIISALHVILPRFSILPGTCCAIALVMIFTVDRQYAAAQFAISRASGLDLPLAEEMSKEAANAEKRRIFLEQIAKIVPKGEMIFSEDEDLAIRYYALRPLAHSFKDGYIHFYNKNLAGSRKWLELEKDLAAGPDGLIRAWLASGAPWLLCKASTDRATLEQNGKIELDEDGWLLVKKS